jgi:hypothetical protein
MNTFANSWALIKSSAKVLRSDKELIIFPIISSIGVLLLSAVFFVPMLLLGLFNNVAETGMQVTDYLLLFAFYVLQYLIIFFSNTALVGAAMIRIRGGDPTVADGLKIAWARFRPIFLYALIAATIGMLLNLVKNKGGALSNIVVSIIGFVWNVATFLVVPILAVEDVGPIEAIKRSVNYLKKTWGEQLVGSFSLGAIFTLIIFVLIIGAVGMIVLVLSSGGQAWVAVAVGVITLLVIVLISLVSTTLNGIYTAAIYQYASAGDTGTYFDSEMIQGAFHTTNKQTLR